MSLKMSILGLLSNKEMTGYDLYKVFDGTLKFYLSAQQSQIYRELNDLEGLGYVSARFEEQESKPTRKLYRITQEGEEALFEWLIDCGEEQHFSQRMHYMTKVIFGSKIPDEELLGSISRFRAIAQKKRDELQRAYENEAEVLAPLGVPADEFMYWEMTIDYGLRLHNVNIEWADTCIALLEKKIKAEKEETKTENSD